MRPFSYVLSLSESRKIEIFVVITQLFVTLYRALLKNLSHIC